jgi:hypothetical protein
LVLIVHINLELSSCEKRLSELCDSIRKHYDTRTSAQSDKPANT